MDTTLVGDLLQLLPVGTPPLGTPLTTLPGHVRLGAARCLASYTTVAILDENVRRCPMPATLNTRLQVTLEHVRDSNLDDDDCALACSHVLPSPLPPSLHSLRRLDLFPTPTTGPCLLHKATADATFGTCSRSREAGRFFYAQRFPT